MEFRAYDTTLFSIDRFYKIWLEVIVFVLSNEIT